MLYFFKHNSVAQLVVIFLVTLLMWLGAFSSPVVLQMQGEGVLYVWLSSVFCRYPLLSAILAFILVVVEGFWLNNILYNAHLVPQDSMLAMFAYVVAMSLSPATQTLTSMIFVNAMLLLCLQHLLLRTSLASVPFTTVFVASALVSLCTLFSPSSVSLLVPLVLVFIIYSLYNVRDIWMFLLGFLAPYIPFLLYYYVKGRLSDFVTTIFGYFGRVDVVFQPVSVFVWIDIVVVCVVVLLALFVGNAKRKDHIIVVDKNNAVVSFFMIGGIVMALYTSFVPFNFQYVAPSFAYFVSLLFVNVREKSKFWNILFIACCLLLIFTPLFL